MNNKVIAGKIINKELGNKLLKIDLNSIKYITIAGTSKIDGMPFIIISKNILRRMKINELFSDFNDCVISDIEREILKAFEDNNKEILEIIMI
jgi:hypothetical protein